MQFRVAFAVVVGSLLASAAAHAQDEIFLRGKEKSAKGKVTQESPKAVVAGKETFSAEEVDDIVYELTSLELRIGVYRPAVKAEKDSLDPANEGKRPALVAEALKKYEEAAAKTKDPLAKRHLEYKVAMLLVRQVQEDGAPPGPALVRLKAFADKNADGWQIGSALRTLAQLHLDTGDATAAQETYRQLAALPVGEETKQEAELLALQVGIKGAKDEAGRKAALAQLNALVAKLPKDSRFAARARVAQALGLAEAKQYDKAVPMLQQVIKDSADRQVKAEAHNALGYCFFKTEKYREARWEFLWVDVVYNQDKGEQAKALYHLWKVFEALGEAERAQEAREALISDRQFAGLEFQRLAQRETKTP